jgi:predicted kinase
VNKPKLYFFVGFPGAGKTTLAKSIADATGATHIWADDERHQLFPAASHTAMRDIADRQKAETVMIWLNVPREIAKNRAVCSDKVRNGYKISMSNEQFDAIADKLEPPTDQEKYINIDDIEQDENTLKHVLDS